MFTGSGSLHPAPLTGGTGACEAGRLMAKAAPIRDRKKWADSRIDTENQKPAGGKPKNCESHSCVLRLF